MSLGASSTLLITDGHQVFLYVLATIAAAAAIGAFWMVVKIKTRVDQALDALFGVPANDIAGTPAIAPMGKRLALQEAESQALHEADARTRQDVEVVRGLVEQMSEQILTENSGSTLKAAVVRIEEKQADVMDWIDEYGPAADANMAKLAEHGIADLTPIPALKRRHPRTPPAHPRTS